LTDTFKVWAGNVEEPLISITNTMIEARLEEIASGASVPEDRPVQLFALPIREPPVAPLKRSRKSRVTSQTPDPLPLQTLANQINDLQQQVLGLVEINAFQQQVLGLVGSVLPTVEAFVPIAEDSRTQRQREMAAIVEKKKMEEVEAKARMEASKQKKSRSKTPAVIPVMDPEDVAYMEMMSKLKGVTLTDPEDLVWQTLPERAA
jgi:hypothetical protein